MSKKVKTRIAVSQTSQLEMSDRLHMNLCLTVKHTNAQATKSRKDIPWTLNLALSSSHNATQKDQSLARWLLPTRTTPLKKSD